MLWRVGAAIAFVRFRPPGLDAFVEAGRREPV
jgi:hypothetical protein